MLLLMKLTGLVMLFCSFYLAGVAAASRVEQRPKDLRGVIRGLELLQTEVEYGLMRLAPALERVAQALDGRSLGRVRRFFQEVATGIRPSEHERDTPTAGEAWSRALQELQTDGCMSARDLAILHGLGDILGASGVADQVRHLQATTQALRCELEEADSDSRRLGKVYRSTWSAIGGCLVLLLM